MSAPHEERVDDAEERDGHRPSPPVLLAALYGAAILVGAAPPKLPFGSREALTWSDAPFTATSVVTVTGLVVIEPAEVPSGFGQAVVLLLIQLGATWCSAWARRASSTTSGAR